MHGFFTLDEYHRRVVGELEKLGWAKTLGVYPEIPDSFETPAIFLDIASWQKEPSVVLGGAMTVTLDCNLYVLRHFKATDYEKLVRNAAMTMSAWIEDRTFGAGTAPADFNNAEPASWETKDGKTSPEHAIWVVNYAQNVAVGIDPFEPPADAPRLKEIFIGLAPDVGPEHVDEYTRIYPRGDVPPPAQPGAAGNGTGGADEPAALPGLFRRGP